MSDTVHELRPVEVQPPTAAFPVVEAPLPSELSGHRQSRVGFIALMYAAVYVVAWGLPFLLGAGARPAAEALVAAGVRSAAEARQVLGGPPVGAVAGAASVVGALALWAWSRRAELAERTVCRMGLALQVLGAFGIAMREQWELGLHAQTRFGPGMTWVAFWILLFPMLVPTHPRRALMGSLLAAAMVPLVWAAYVLSGAPRAPTTDVVLHVFPGFLAAGTAYFASRFIYRLGSGASRAHKLGSYELGDQLAQGGMGEVWKAQHELLKRPAAVKVIRPERLRGAGDQNPETTLRRFAREATATAVLESPHTVTVYDYGTTVDGTFYYVMELLNGLDLETLVRRYGPLPSERVAYIVAQVLKSLADAHAHGLVHRDIKPANIFLARMGTQFDFVKVLDFGLVTAATGTSADLARLTAEGIASGTPAYMAPEVASGDSVVGPAVDIYSLGCVAWWLLTGRVVFEGDSAMQVVIRHVRDEPTPPSRVSELPIHPEVERLVMAMLSKDPAARPAPALALACDFASIAFDTPWDERAALRWWRLHEPGLVAGLRLDPSDASARMSA